MKTGTPSCKTYTHRHTHTHTHVYTQPIELRHTHRSTHTHTHTHTHSTQRTGEEVVRHVDEFKVLECCDGLWDGASQLVVVHVQGAAVTITHSLIGAQPSVQCDTKRHHSQQVRQQPERLWNGASQLVGVQFQVPAVTIADSHNVAPHITAYCQHHHSHHACQRAKRLWYGTSQLVSKNVTTQHPLNTHTLTASQSAS
jgi:hypothetical protein